jgi:hypothetical protein
VGTAAAAALLVLSACGGSKNNASTPASSAPLPAVSASATPSSSSTPSTGPSATPSDTPAGVVVHIDLVGGRASTEPKPIVKVKQGETLTLVATSDTPLEIHVHGYDKMIQLTPGQTGTVSFVADQQGTFEVEIESTKTHLFNLQVQ